jgi:hypothetical protein
MTSNEKNKILERINEIQGGKIDFNTFECIPLSRKDQIELSSLYGKLESFSSEDEAAFSKIIQQSGGKIMKLPCSKTDINPFFKQMRCAIACIQDFRNDTAKPQHGAICKLFDQYSDAMQLFYNKHHDDVNFNLDEWSYTLDCLGRTLG